MTQESHVPVRDLSPDESSVVELLLSADFPGAVELREQAKWSRIGLQDHGGVVTIGFAPTGDHPVAPVEQRIPVEAEANDQDGMTIHLLLHVVGGMLREIEIFREDSAPIRRFPSTGDLKLLVN